MYSGSPCGFISRTEGGVLTVSEHYEQSNPKAAVAPRCMRDDTECSSMIVLPTNSVRNQRARISCWRRGICPLGVREYWQYGTQLRGLSGIRFIELTTGRAQPRLLPALICPRQTSEYCCNSAATGSDMRVADGEL